ncbi:MAG: DUF2027 domain-containing protein [Bacteroidetes bacterium]|nr:DUF2027 domain-containing protein [Bacteroidota bacterium]
MRLNIGDKVRFLNEAIEGIVTRILSNERVEITTTEGFTQTAAEQHLVKVEFTMEEKVVEPEEQSGKQETAGVSSREKNPDAKAIYRPPFIPSLKNDETIYAAFVLKDERIPLTSDIEFTLINNCSYSIVYSLSKKKSDLRSGVAAGLLKSRTEQFIGTFSQDELHTFDGFTIEFLFFEENDFVPRPPAEKHISITSSDFIAEEYWETLKGRDERILLMPLHMIHAEKEVSVKKLLDRYQKKEEEDKARSELFSKGSKNKMKPRKFVLLSKEKVVDLHIEELVKDHASMSNAQIISYQLNFFHFEMDQAILNKLNKIIFIHGVGQGVLKSAIKEELKKFPNIRYREASSEKFGYGATEVEFI